MQLPDLFQQLEVLHVARADTQHVRVARDQFDVGRLKDLRDGRHAGLRAHLREDLEAALRQALERVRRRAVLVRVATKDVRACRFRGARGRHRLLLRFDRAGPGDDDERVAPDDDVADLDLGRLGTGLARDELVRLADAHDGLDARHAGDRQRHEALGIADQADDRAVLAARDEGIATGVLDYLDDARDIFLARVQAHHHDHGVLLICSDPYKQKAPGSSPGASVLRPAPYRAKAPGWPEVPKNQKYRFIVGGMVGGPFRRVNAVAAKSLFKDCPNGRRGKFNPRASLG